MKQKRNNKKKGGNKSNNQPPQKNVEEKKKKEVVVVEEQNHPTNVNKSSLKSDSNKDVSKTSSSVANVGSSKVVEKKKSVVATSNVDNKKAHSDLKSNENKSNENKSNANKSNENLKTSTKKLDSGNFENVLKADNVVKVNDDSSDSSSSSSSSSSDVNSSNGSASSDKENIHDVYAFVYNFLRDNSFYDTLAAFEKEYGEKFEDIEVLKTQKHRNIFAQITLLKNEIQTYMQFKKEAEDCLEEAHMDISQLKKERDNYLMRHKRSEQEKATLYKDLQRHQNEMQILQKTLAAQKTKCEILRKEKVMIMMEKDKYSSKVEGMNNYINRLKELLGCCDDNESNQNTEIAEVIASGYGEQRGPQGRRLFRNEQSGGNSSVPRRKLKDTPWPADDNESDLDFPIRIIDPQEKRGLNTVYHLKEVHYFKGHNSAVAGMDYNFNINMLATGSDDHTWKIWTGTDGELIMASQRQRKWLGCACFHPDGKILCTAGGDGKVKLWNLEKEMCIHAFKQHAGPVWNVSFHREGNFMASCSLDHTVRIFDINGLKQRQILRGHTDSVNSVKFHPFSNMLATASADRTVSIWDMRTGLCRNTFYEHEFPCNDVSYNCVTNWVISCDCGGVVKIWDLRTNQCLLSLDIGPVSANKCATDMVGDLLYIASDDTMLKVFDFQKKRFVKSFHHKSAVKSVVVGPDTIYTGLSNGDIHIWSA